VLVNGADGISDIQDKAATGSGEQAGDASEFQWSRGGANDIDGQAERPNERERMSQSFPSLNQS